MKFQAQRGICRVLVTIVVAFAAPLAASCEQQDIAVSHSDSDRDGLEDALEQRLLEQFLPSFMVNPNDCSVRPAAFQRDVITPQVKSEDGTVYGQAFPGKEIQGNATVELHYYHLWRKDCGGHGHALDTEHVSALVQAASPDSWRALYWYAAAHEDTVCDVSQVARATTLHAEQHGPMVWISQGKHASYLDEPSCSHGCGADRCEPMVPLTAPRVINLGEPGASMNGSSFIESSEWPLREKMSRSDFPVDSLVRLGDLSPSEIAWAHVGRHPVQGIIARSSATEQALTTSRDGTTAALSVAGGSTGAAITTAGESTGGAVSGAGQSTDQALEKSYRNTRRALATSLRKTGRALHFSQTPTVQGDRPE